MPQVCPAGSERVPRSQGHGRVPAWALIGGWEAGTRPGHRAWYPLFMIPHSVRKVPSATYRLPQMCQLPPKSLKPGQWGTWGGSALVC